MKTFNFSLVISQDKITSDLENLVYDMWNGDVSVFSQDNIVGLMFTRKGIEISVVVEQATKEVTDAGLKVLRVDYY